MYRSRWKSALVALTAVALLAAGCGDDDEGVGDADDASEDAGDDVTSGDDGSGEDDASDDDEAVSATADVTMVDFGYEVSGTLGAGVQSFTTRNDGDELHMMGIGKLKDGASIEAFAAALTEQGEEGGTDERAEEDATEEGNESGEEGGGDPFAEFIEGEVGTPGHILLPGVEQTITLPTGLDAGSYALICFIPSEGDGVPHFAKGMVNELVVTDEDGGGTAPTPSGEYSLADDAEPAGPAELSAGEVTLAVTNDGEIGKDFIVANLDEGEDFSSFDEFFVSTFEGEEPPPEGAAGLAPGEIRGSTFEISPGQTIYLTVELTAGTWYFVSTMNDAAEGVDGDARDFIFEVTVT